MYHKMPMMVAAPKDRISRRAVVVVIFSAQRISTSRPFLFAVRHVGLLWQSQRFELLQISKLHDATALEGEKDYLIV